MKPYFFFTWVAAAALLAGCGPNSTTSSNGAAERFTKPTSVQVQRRDITGYDMLKGAIYMPPEAQVSIYPKYNAPVQKVDAAVGDNVKRGQILVELAFPDVQAALQNAKDTYQAAQSAYESAKTQYDGPVKQAKQAVDQARSTERQIRSQTTPGGDATDLQQARSAREAAEQTLQQATADFNANMLIYKQQLDSAQAALTEARNGAKQAFVRSPIGGTLLVLNAQVGQTLGGDPKTPVATVANLAALQLKADLTPEQVTKVKVGTPVVAQFKETGDKVFDGKVSRIRTLPGSSGGPVVTEATIDLQNVSALVKSGMTITLLGVRTGEVKDVLAVPVQAVDQDSAGHTIVHVQKNGTWTDVSVETGLSDGNYTEIRSGLNEGDTIQVTP